MSSAAPTQTLFDGKLGQGWYDGGSGTHDLAHGSARINLAELGGWVLRHERLVQRFGGLSFRMLAPNSFGDFLQVQVSDGEKDDSRVPVDIGPQYESTLPDGWIYVLVPWSELNPTGAPFDRVSLHAHKPVGSESVQFDEIVLQPATEPLASGSATLPPMSRAGSASRPAAVPVDASTRLVQLAVDCSARGHSISPYIYGVAGDLPELSATARRWGGNPTSRYNWQLGTVFNAGKDWYFENQKSEHYAAFLLANASRHVFSALTVPTIGWVAKDDNSFGFPISVYGAQRAHDPFRTDAGDGTRVNGDAILPKSPEQTSVEAPPAMIGKWVRVIREHDSKLGARSVGLYILDNEPSLWNSTHRDVHPAPLTYDELLDRAIRYGGAIREADPDAKIAGPAEWGWPGYFYSARDVLAGLNARPDRRAHADVPLIPWYLRKLREHEKATGQRVLDVLDVHFYPQDAGVYGDAQDAATSALRIRSTRSLWDPTYKDESWINDTIELIPRLKDWVRQNYPGLAISIGEYNFGGEKHISGALALAEALGRFGTAGLDYAFYWNAPPKDTPVYWAFRAYRNFDGKNGQFLSRAVDTLMAPGVSLFASRDESGKHLVLITLNLDPNASASAAIDLSGCGVVATRHDYAYGPGLQSLTEQQWAAGENGTFRQRLGPYTINVSDITLK